MSNTPTESSKIDTANGTVIVGVDDDKTVVGLKEPLKDEERLARAIADSIEPLLLVNIQHASRGEQSVLVIDGPFTPRPYYLRKEGPERGVYVREGSTNFGPSANAKVRDPKVRASTPQIDRGSTQRPYPGPEGTGLAPGPSGITQAS
jgi:predicted HTH transcriptional regulator